MDPLFFMDKLKYIGWDIVRGQAALIDQLHERHVVKYLTLKDAPLVELHEGVHEHL